MIAIKRVCILCLLSWLFPVAFLRADDIPDLRRDLAASQSEVQQLKAQLAATNAKIDRIDADADLGTLLFIGVFCALWAQYSHRNAWLWFFLGVFFNVITLLVLLFKNSRDLGRARQAQAQSTLYPA